MVLILEGIKKVSQNLHQLKLSGTAKWIWDGIKTYSIVVLLIAKLCLIIFESREENFQSPTLAYHSTIIQIIKENHVKYVE